MVAARATPRPAAIYPAALRSAARGLWQRSGCLNRVKGLTFQLVAVSFRVPCC